MNAAPGLTRDEAVERATKISAQVRDRWSETERARRVTDETMAELKAAGLMRVNQPARFGGDELGVEAVVDIASTLAEGDVSVGWAYTILVSHNWIVGLFPDQAQRDVWGTDPTRLASSSFAPSRATVERVDGGYRLRDGLWPWSSGSDFGSWAMVGFRAGPPNEAGLPPVRWGLIERGQYDVRSDWRTISAQGTGSNSLQVDDAVIPDHRIIDPLLAMIGQTPGAEVNPSPLFRLSFSNLALYLAAPILGGARAAVKSFAAYMETKKLIYTGQRVGTEGAMLVHMGEVAAKVSVAETVLRAAARAQDESGGEPVDPGVTLAMARDATFAVRLCADTVDDTMRWSGASAIFEDHHANKWWRDVRALAAHQGFNTDTAYGNWGRMTMGLPLLPGPFG